MSRRGSEAGSPSRLGKRKSTAEVATGSTRKSRKSAGESSAHSQQQKSAKRTGKKDGKKKPPKAKLLNAGEREQVVDCVIEEDVLSYVLKEVPNKLIGDLFPERKVFWLSLLPEKIQTLVHSAVIKYLTLYRECGQIKDRSAVLYMKWLQYERMLVCTSMKASESIMDTYKEGVGDVSEDTIRTVVTLILNTVYKGIVKQMANKIEHTFCTATTDDTSTSPSDDVALHRICGWALKSVINKVSEQSKRQPSEQVRDTLELLKALKLPNDDKIHLPHALQYLDRGGLTFMLDAFLPWMHAIEERMVLNLNVSCYQRYGEKLFEATKNSVEMDNTLLEKFTVAVNALEVDTTQQAVNEAHNMLIWKIYNARCNEFLRSTIKLSCIQKDRCVDASTGLRDKLKVFAVEKLSTVNEN